MILSGIDLQVDVGECVAMLGRSGSGKTTLARALYGAIPCRRGVIRFMDEVVTSEAAYERANRGIAYVPQGRQIFLELSVMENLVLDAYAAQFDKTRTDRAVEKLLEYFHTLKPKLKDLGGGLNAGQQQLLAVARALMSEPKILLLDEPSDGVDPSLLDEIAATVKKNLERDRPCGTHVRAKPSVRKKTCCARVRDSGRCYQTKCSH
ncbi:ATP-binding cassette domain-containing protein [Paraburkholderia bengalensis]|uniref:ATP-binding cassette domain-containing protein n=1 Tax=Paraburkholderia bengalensis TaxID=2747562 RepID=A0ABU8J649_9BURK